MTHPIDSNISLPSTSEETTILGEGKREIPGALAEELGQDAYITGVAFLKTKADGSHERVDPRDVYVATPETPEDIRRTASAIMINAMQTGAEVQIHQCFVIVEMITLALVAERNRCLEQASFPAYWHLQDDQSALALIKDIRRRIREEV